MSKLKSQNYNSKFKTIKLFVLALIFAFYTLALSGVVGLILLNPISVKAQVVDLDPSSWQTGATGLRTASNADRKTAGLTVSVKAFGIPFINLQGGLRGTEYRVVGPTNIDLGEIKLLTDTSVRLTSETTDWVRNEMTFSNNLKLWVSRLSPALLIQNPGDNLRMFSGNLNTVAFVPTAWDPNSFLLSDQSLAPSYPKYVAYSSDGSIQVRQIPASGTSPLVLPALDNNWILVWYGNNSHFAETKTPISYSDGILNSSILNSDAYQADAPVLLKFQNNLISIRQSSEGGIDLDFGVGVNSGYTSLMPLLGREHPRASDTESWYSTTDLVNHNGLPPAIQSKINFWTNNTNNRLCSYPTNVSESYNYNSSNDTSTITENITYLYACSGGSTTSGFAVLPPSLSLAKDVLGNTFSLTGTLIDANYPTEFGPILGIDNTNTYSWSISGLKKYTDNKRVVNGQSNVPQELIEELSREIDIATSSGHYKPWIMGDSTPRHAIRGDIYFLNPADVIQSLTEVVEVALEPQKNSLINYIKTERGSYPPETVANLPNIGTLRVPSSLDNYLSWEGSIETPVNIFIKRVPLFNFYALSRYYDLTGESIPNLVISAGKTALNQDMVERDFATFSWFKGFSQDSTVINVNRHLAGIIGLVRLMKLTGDSDEGLVRSLLAKAAVSKISMVTYPRYLYSSGLNNLPSSSAWMPEYLAGKWNGHIWVYQWAQGLDDPRQSVILNQFSNILSDNSGFIDPVYKDQGWANQWLVPSSHLVTYRDVVPEVYRLLNDFVKQESEILINKYTTLLPHWYSPFTEAILGQEHAINHPVDSYQIFMAKAILQRESGQNLRKFRSIPYFTNGGDFFYMHKLAETIKAYQGWKWEDEDIGVGIPGDVNYDSQVDVLDIQACVNHILGIQDQGNRADVNQDGSVDVLDVQVIVNIILGV